MVTRYIPTIGLEIHAELKTQTKMFCDSKNDPDASEPNMHICPVCMGHPGTLPVVNREAVRHVLRVGLALGGKLADYAEFDRKSYFYPDLPKGYQISQYAYPLVAGGNLADIAITRVHLEEDTGRLVHGGVGSESGQSATLVDFNRAGVPLMELVTDPVIRSAEEAVRFARELQLLLRTLEASEANMEKGEMRVEANISIAPEGASKLGTKVEVKNLNSFRAVERAIIYELARHETLLNEGKSVVQETRGWNEGRQETFSQRLKEDSHDYRYFPDPDVPKLVRSEIEEFSDAILASSLPELPHERRARYGTLGLKSEDVEVLVYERYLGELFDKTVERIDATFVPLAANYLTSDAQGLLVKYKEVSRENERSLSPENFAELMIMIGKGEISSRVGKDLLTRIFREGGNPRDLATQEGLLQLEDSDALQRLAQDIIERNPKVAEEYRAGKEAALQFLLGAAMRETRGSANPSKLQEVFRRALG